MQSAPYQPKNAGLGWLAQAVSGLLLIALLALHLVANHFVVPGGLQTYQDVLRYLSNPLILVLELIFLCVVTTHALLGVRAIILDIRITHESERLVNRILIILGVLIIVYALGLTLTLIR